MPISFPLYPADGTLYQMGGITYKYSLADDKWVSVGGITSGGSGVIPPNDIYAGLIQFDANNGVFTVTRNDMVTLTVDLDGRYVDRSGDVMEGLLTLSGDPVSNLDAVTKQYVDTLIAAANDIHTSSAAIDANGVLVQTRNDGSTYSVDLFASMDARYVNVTGDTMTGPLTVIGDVNLLGNTNVNNFTAAGTTTLNGDVYTNQNLYANNVTVAGNTVFDGDVTVNQTLTSNTLVVNNESTFNGNTVFTSNVTVEQTFTTNNIIVDGTTTLNGNTYITGTLNAAAVDIALGDLNNVSAVAPANNQVLQWNGTEWIPAALPPATTDTKLNGMTFDSTTRVLTATVSDGNIFSATIPAEIDDFVNAVAFDSTTRTLTISRTDGQTFTSVIPDSDQFVNIVSFNDATNTLTINRNDGQVFTTVIPDEDKYVSSAAFNTGTRTLTLTRNDGGTVSVIIPDSDVFLSNSTFDVATRTLTLTRNDGTLFTHVIPDTNTFTTGLNFNTTSRVLTLTRNDGVSLTTTIPQTSIASLIDNVTYNDASRTLSVTKADGTATAYLISDADTKLSSLAFDNLTRVLTATLSDGTTKTATIAESADKLTTLSLNTNILSYKDELGNTTNIDLSLYLDDTNLARLVSGTLNATTGIATFMRDDATNFTVDLSGLKDIDTFTSNAAFNSSTNVLTFTRNNASTYTVDLTPLKGATIPNGTVDGSQLSWDSNSSSWVEQIANAQALWTYPNDTAALTAMQAINPARTGRIYYNTTTNKVRINDGTNWSDLVPASSGVQFTGTGSTFNGIPRYSDLTGQIIKNSSVTISDQGLLTSTSVQTGSMQLEGYYNAKFNTLSGSFPTVNLDWKGTTYYKITLATGNAPTVAFVNVPLPGYVSSMTLEVLAQGGTLNWPTNVKFPNGGTAPTLTTGKTYLFMLTTSNAGVTVLASTLNDYTA